MDPFAGMDAAFAPLYNEMVKVHASRGAQTLSQTLTVCVMACGTDEPYSEGAVDTQREALAFIFCEGDWRYVSELRRGDTITRYNPERTYRVEAVKRDDALGVVVEARSVE